MNATQAHLAVCRPLAAGRRVRAVWSAVIAFGAAVVFSATAFAQAPPAAAAPQSDGLATLVGRIALYPDDLVTIILPAATSPLQIVQADRYLDKRKSDPKLPIDDNWDDPVKSLLNYPDIVKMMSNDLDWTSELGEAVVTDQGAVLEAVQVFRRQAQAAGNLKSDDKQVVKTEKEIVIIEPADPQVVYVPQYNPSSVVVYGAAPVWGYYPTPYPSYYYPYAPGAALAAGVIWGAAIGAAWSGNRYGWGGNNDININRNTNISGGDRTVNRGQGGQAGGGQWKSNKQPGQVSSSVGKASPSNRAGDARGAGGARASSQPAGGFDRGGAGADRGGAGADRGGAGADRGGAGADRGGAGFDRGGGAGGARPSTQPAGGGSRGGDSAFGGYNSGRQTQMDSSRGASSRGSSYGGAGAGASHSGGGGGARGGGGGRGGGGRR